MFSLSKLSVLLAAVAAFANATPETTLEARQGSCKQVHMIVARASTELPGEGVIGTVAAGVRLALSGRVSSEAVNYPALLSPYDSSSAEGTQAVIKMLNSISQRCPESKIVLMGYSQGAHIIGDAICGGGGVLGLGKENPPISAEVAKKIAAVVQMGDPRHTRSESYHKGTAILQGLFPRRKDQSCEAHASKWVSYCDLGDTFCDSGVNMMAHFAYVLMYGLAAQKHITDRV